MARRAGLAPGDRSGWEVSWGYGRGVALPCRRMLRLRQVAPQASSFARPRWLIPERTLAALLNAQAASVGILCVELSGQHLSITVILSHEPLISGTLVVQ